MQPGDLVTVTFERSQGEEPPALGILMNRYSCADLGPQWEVLIEGVVKVAHQGEISELQAIKYGADPSEIRAGNLGITADGRVVLIDSATPGRQSFSDIIKRVQERLEK